MWCFFTKHNAFACGPPYDRVNLLRKSSCKITSYLFLVFVDNYLLCTISGWTKCYLLAPRFFCPWHVAAEARVWQRGIPHFACVSQNFPLRLSHTGFFAAGKHCSKIVRTFEIFKWVKNIMEVPWNKIRSLHFKCIVISPFKCNII